jgi:predicted nucleic acid-binding protein
VAARVVVADACVLYSALLRDLLMHLCLKGLIQLRWSDAIHDEWTRSLIANRPDLDPARINRTRALMERALPAASAYRYDELIDALVLPDPDDRHVLAAAIHCGSEVIVTFNLSDFPDVALSRYRVEALHPDDLFAELIASDAVKFVGAVRELRAALQNPAYTPNEVIDALRRIGLPKSASVLTAMKELF